MKQDPDWQLVDKDTEPFPYVISIPKLIILSFTTFGLYEIYWFYKQYKSFKAETNWKIIPWLWALFAHLLSYSLFKKVSFLIKDIDKKRKLEYFGLAIAYLIFGFVARFPEPYSLISLLSFLPLIPLQKAINFYWQKKLGKELKESKFGRWNYSWAIGGSIFLLLALVGTLRPD